MPPTETTPVWWVGR